MSINKSAVLVGTDSITNLPIYRRFNDVNSSRKWETIKVTYDEFLMSNGQEVIPYKKVDWRYTITDLVAIEAKAAILDENGNIVTPAIEAKAAFPGFTSWFTKDIGGLPTGGVALLGPILVSSIDLTLKELPIDAPNDFVLPHPNV